MTDTKYKEHVGQCTECTQPVVCDEWKPVAFIPEKAVSHLKVCQICTRPNHCATGWALFEEIMAAIVMEYPETLFAQYIVDQQVEKLL
jgi:hypothetical protein